MTAGFSEHTHRQAHTQTNTHPHVHTLAMWETEMVNGKGFKHLTRWKRHQVCNTNRTDWVCDRGTEWGKGERGGELQSTLRFRFRGQHQILIILCTKLEQSRPKMAGQVSCLAYTISKRIAALSLPLSFSLSLPLGTCCVSGTHQAGKRGTIPATFAC